MNRFAFPLRMIVYLFLFVTPPAVGQVVDERVVVGVLQSSGVVIPFARYDGVGWLNTWPLPEERSNVPSQPAVANLREWLGGETAPAMWRIWLQSGTSHEVRTVGLELIKSQCGANWGFMTDFPKAVDSCRYCCPDALVGIALSTDHTIYPTPQADHSLLPYNALERAFNATESREVAELQESQRRSGTYYGPPLDLKARSVVPIRVERAWAMAIAPGKMLYYIEAVRRYVNVQATNEVGCPYIAAFRGWITVNRERQGKAIDTKLDFTDCDFKGASFVKPLAMFDFKSGRYAIVQNNGWESQSYGLVKIESGRIVTIIDAPVR